MKKIITLITIFTCIFTLGCSAPHKQIYSLEEAYFYLLDKIESNEYLEIDEVKNLLKNYELKVLNHFELYDINGEKSYEYIFQDDKKFLTINFVKSKNKEIIDFLQYSTDDDNSNLMSFISDDESNFILDYKKLDVSFYEKLFSKSDNMDISLPNNDSKFKDVYTYILKKSKNGDNITIDEVKSQLSEYNLRVELASEKTKENKNIYNYEFFKNDSERLLLTTTIVNNLENVSSISHFIGQPTDIHFYYSIPVNKEKPILSASFYADDINSYKKFYNTISKIM